MAGSRGKQPAESEAERRERQAEALRENLRRRKEQARARQGDAAEAPPANAPAKTSGDWKS